MISSYGCRGDDKDQALLDRVAKREERRERRAKEALERQRESDLAVTEGTDSLSVEQGNEDRERPSRRRGRYHDDEDEEKASARREEEAAAPEGGEEAEEGVDEEGEAAEAVEDKPRSSYFREEVRSHLAFCCSIIAYLCQTRSGH